MQYAASIRYGGMLVQPEQCDYESYDRLKLVCPNCKAQVFLVKGSERGQHTRTIKDKATGAQKKVEVKQAIVPPHFSHFHLEHESATQSQADVCELRVASYSKKEIAQAAQSARNQRNKVFQRNFWRLICMSHKMAVWQDDIEFAKQGFMNACPARDPDNFRLHKWNKFVKMFVDRFSSAQEMEYMKGIISDTMRSIAVDIEAVGDAWFENFSETTAKCLKLWQRSVIESQMQVAIAIEALEFLANKRNRAMVEDLFAIALTSWAINQSDEDYGSGLLNPNFLSNNQKSLYAAVSKLPDRFAAVVYATDKEIRTLFAWCYANLAMILATTPWADGFEKLEQGAEDFKTIGIENDRKLLKAGIWHYTVNTGHGIFQPFSRDYGSVQTVLKWAQLIVKEPGTNVYPFPNPFQDCTCKITFNPKEFNGISLFDIGKGSGGNVQQWDEFYVSCALVWSEEGDRFAKDCFSNLYNHWKVNIFDRLRIPANEFKLPDQIPYLAVMTAPLYPLPMWIASAEIEIAHAILMEAIRQAK